MSAKKKASEESFGQRMTRLEAIVERLESEEIELEEALAAFEEGVKLAKSLGAGLDAAERRIEVLLRQNSGEVGLENFDPGLDDETPTGETEDEADED